MYESFYGLKEKPFSMLPDPSYLYLSRQHDMVITLLEYSLENQAGFCVITGKAGTGKTTLLRRLLHRAGDDVAIGLISNTHHSFGELMRWILLAFDLDEGDKTRAELHQIFVDYLIRQYAKNRRTMLIIDEAQNMSPDALEELRMLSNINSEKDLLLQVILVGQPPLRDILRRPDLEQFAQRVAVDYHLESLSREETFGYVRHRVVVAGGERDLFSDDACDAVFEHSGGTPRLINLLCDIALVYAYAGHAAVVTGEVVEQVVREREMHGALPVFAKSAHATQASPVDVSRTSTAVGTPSGVALDVRSVMSRAGSGISSRSFSTIAARDRVHAMERSSAKVAPETIATAGQTVEAVNTGRGVQSNADANLVVQAAQQSHVLHGSNEIAIEANVSTVAAASLVESAKVIRESERLVNFSHSETNPNKNRTSIVTGKSRISSVASDASPQERPDNPSTISRQETVKRQTVTVANMQKGFSKDSSARRYLTAAAAIVLSLSVYIGWLFFNRNPDLTFAEPSGSSQAHAVAATPAVEMTPTNGMSTTKAGSQTVLPENLLPTQNTGVTSVVTENNPPPVETKKTLIEHEWNVAVAKVKAVESERNPLRSTTIVRGQALAAEREAALAWELDNASQIAREAEKAKQEARATEAAAATQIIRPEFKLMPAPQAAVSASSSVTPAGLDGLSRNQDAEGGNDETISFSANPCKGLSAIFLSTCQ